MGAEFSYISSSPFRFPPLKTILLDRFQKHISEVVIFYTFSQGHYSYTFFYDFGK